MHRYSGIDASADAYTQEKEQLEGKRARVASRERARACYSSFLNRASSADERESRLSLIESQVRATVEAACQEHGYEDVDSVLTEVVADLKKTEIKEANETNYQNETVDPETTMDSEPSVETGGNSSYHAEEIDVKSERNRKEHIEPDREQPEFTSEVTNDDAASPKLLKTVDAESAIDSEVGSQPASFPSGNDGSAVTSSWSVLD